MNYFLSLWEHQAFVMIAWSVACFLLGNAFCATCYWYRIRHVMNNATHKVEALSKYPPGEAPQRRSTDSPS